VWKAAAGSVNYNTDGILYHREKTFVAPLTTVAAASINLTGGIRCFTDPRGTEWG